MTFIFSHADFEKELLRECESLGLKLEFVAKNVFSTELGTPIEFVWARDWWFDVKRVPITSISDGARRLREVSKRPWLHVTTDAHRRGELIEATFFSKKQLEQVRGRRSGWPAEMARGRRNPAFTLLSPSEMAYCDSPAEDVPGGEWIFNEDREGPPSRAYLKLWEWGWRADVLPKSGERALDLGACPGGWTWVLLKAGLVVHSFDRAPLAESLHSSLTAEEFRRLTFSKADAFQILPVSAPETDWVFCDVIAEPERSVELIEAWAETSAGLVFTVKFKGEANLEILNRLRKIARSHVRHLYVNRHEVTFWRDPVSK